MILFELNACSCREKWQAAAAYRGITLSSLDGRDLEKASGREAARRALLSAMEQEKTLLLFADHGMQEGMREFLSTLPEELLSVPIGSDALLLSRGTADPVHTGRINAYLTYGGEENLHRLMDYLSFWLFGNTQGPEPAPPEILPMDGIYQGEQVFDSLPSFLQARKKIYPVYVGMLSHRSSWLQKNLQPEQALIDALAKKNIGVIPVFAAGEKSQLLQSLDFEDLVRQFFTENGRLFIDGLINFQLHLIKGSQGKTLAQVSSELFLKLGIPVFHPISSFFVTEKQWREQSNPLAQELNMDYLNPEMAGMIEPILIALRSEDRKSYVPIRENISLLSDRIARWMALRKKDNRDKKVVIMLHNAVCAGVEATLGKAFGMDAFESAARLMKRLREEGYSLRELPEDGKALRELLIRKKAFSDFRWTGVEDIVKAGGCIYRMPVNPEYRSYLQELPRDMQDAMDQSWGPPPGEGMVMGDDLIITGLKFGNVLLMVQPKRGCYGAKCTGEVCRILHDPTCPPTHQYLASYRYLERDWGADAVIHLGTDGSLEYLPGKASGLGYSDWTFQVLGGLPNLYPYHLGVPSEGTIAKRRAGSVIVGYYPASSRGLEPGDQELLKLLDSLQESQKLQNGQQTFLLTQLEQQLTERPILRKLMDSAPTQEEGISLVRSSLLQAAQGRRCSDLHVLGENPSREEALCYLTEVLRGEEAVKKAEGETEADYDFRLRNLLEASLEQGSDPASREIQKLYGLLMKTEEELTRLTDLLQGRFQPPSQAGMPDENGRNILPAGGNFYMMNSDRVPTPAAWQRGRILCDQLLKSYQDDAGSYPHKIAMNMISLDISRTHGEQLSEFLWLLGIRPQWDHTGRVRGLEPIPLSELERPRIDVTLRISGVMRDTWPSAVEMMDRAVMLAASLEESPEDNYLVDNIRNLEGSWEDRAKTIRIFGDPPGAFGAGIDLALKASAWESDRDLTRYFIQSSAYAYGKDLQGEKRIREFVENARSVDLTTDVTSSRRMDTLSCGFGVQVHGGYRLLAKTLGKKEIRQYQAQSELGTPVRTESLSNAMEADVNATLLNALWQENMKKQSYQGAAEIMRRIQTAFDGQCTGQLLRNETLDSLAETYLNEGQMRRWLLEENPYAAEEIGRRLLELHSRGKWSPDPEVLERLRESYLTIDGVMEGGISGDSDIQAGGVEIVRDDQVEIWKKNLSEIDAFLDSLSEDEN